MYNKELAKKRYLVIDDFSEMRSMMQGMLRVFGVESIETARDGKEAIEQLERGDFDVVLCDYNLGQGKDGQQVLEEARHRNLVGIGTIFVMITAENTREMVMGAMEYAPDSYLSKPFTKDVLEARLIKLVAKKADLAAVQKAVQEQKIDLAIKLLDERIRQKPRNIAELTRYKAELCMDAKKYDQAAAVYERVLAAREVPWALMGMGQVHYARGEYDTAKEIFQNLIDQNEGLIGAYDWLAKVHKAQGDTEAAQAILTKAIDISPKAVLRQKALGEIALSNNDLESAEKAFDKAVSVGKFSVFKHPDTYAKLACTKSKQNDNNDALKVIAQLEREFGNDKEAQLFSHSSKSTIYTNMGDEESAKESLKEAEALFDRIGTQLDSSAALEMARACADSGDKQRSLEIMQDMIRNNHDSDELLQDVEAAYKTLGIGGDVKDAIHGVRKEIIKLNNKGVSLTQEGKLEEAIALFEKAADGMRGNRVINLNAAKVLILHMQKNGASADHLGKTRKYLDVVRKLEPDNPRLKQLQEAFIKIAESGD